MLIYISYSDGGNVKIFLLHIVQTQNMFGSHGFVIFKIFGP